MRIGNRTFGGERPRIDPRNLSDDEAIIALDCDLVSSTLRALCAPSLEKEGISADTKTIYFFEGEWFEFDEVIDIAEQSDRLFWTGAEGSRQATLGQLQSGLSYAMGIPKPVAPNVSFVGGTAEPESIAFNTFYVISFVNQFGEEGDKSDPSKVITVQRGQTVTLTNVGQFAQSDQNAVVDSGVTSMRLYILSEGESRFVAEYPITQSIIMDEIGATTLGEVFPSEDFLPPPVGLEGLHLMANGIALGFVPGERLVYVSEPFNANAWPYFFPTEGVPCAISSYDNNAVIITDSYPEVAAINDPRNIVPTTLTYREPCASARGVVQAEGGVIYPSTNGLFYIGHGGGRRLTKDHIDFKDWAKYAPSTMIGIYRDRQYIGFHQGAKEGNALVFDMRDGAILRQLSQKADAAFVKPGVDEAYVASETEILQLEGSEDRLNYVYRSKMYGNGSPFALTSRRVLSCEQIVRSYLPYDDGELEALEVLREESISGRSGLLNVFGFGGVINQKLIAGCPEVLPVGANVEEFRYRTINGISAIDLPRSEDISVSLRLYGDKELVHEETITDDEAIQRLFYFDRRRIYEYELEGNLEISQIDLAGSNSEMHDGT